MSEITNHLIFQEAKAFWQDHYNVETNWYAFWFPMGLWAGCFLYAKLTSKKDFGRWWELHTLHHVGAISLGSLSLYYDDDSIFNERNTILWSLSYFIIDIIETLMTGHILYVGHGTACLLLGLANYNLPLLRTLRMNSQATYIETSSILLYQVKRYRKPWLFCIFAVVYTICRIIWMPFMAKDLFNHGMEYTNPVMVCLGLFYCLNIHWYIKIIKIAINGDGKKNSNDNDEAKKKD